MLHALQSCEAGTADRTFSIAMPRLSGSSRMLGGIQVRSLDTSLNLIECTILQDQL